MLFRSRLIRNWLQVKNSDAIFAIAEDFYTVGDEMNYGKKALITQVKGGTGYAVQMAINEKKPIYVFNQKSGTWFEYKEGGFSSITQDPMLTKNFAGIGSRKINAKGMQAIRNVYETTAGEQNKNHCKK